MLLGTLGASLLGNISPGKGMSWRRNCKCRYGHKKGKGVIAKSQGQGIVRVSSGNKKLKKRQQKVKDEEF